MSPIPILVIWGEVSSFHEDLSWVSLSESKHIHEIHDVIFHTEAPKEDRTLATSFEFKQ